MLLLVMMLSFSLIALSASAATCEGTQEVNIASQAIVSGDIGPDTGMSHEDVHWGVWDHYNNVIDGDPTTLCPVDNNHNRDYGLRLTFDGPYKFTKLVIQPYGQGRAQSSISISNSVCQRENGQTVNVILYSELGVEIFETSFVAGKENVTIDIDQDLGPAVQIYIWFTDVTKAQGIWEIEAYTKETHAWEQTEVNVDPTCDAQGSSTVKCTKCQTVADGIVQHTEHVDKCTGACYVCSKQINKGQIYHEREFACSDVCKKCGTAMTGASGHIADISKPCSNTCVVCGEDKIPDAYSIDRIYYTSTYPAYSYAKHVANPNDPCDTTCFSCKKVNAVKAAHIPDPNDPCNVKECANPDCTATDPFYTISWGNITDYCPHVRGEAGLITSVAGKYSCGIYCADCGKKGAFYYEHVFDNCGDYYCNICNANSQGNTTIKPKEAPHTFTAESPYKCTGCGWLRDSSKCEGHTYTNKCDAYCNSCGAQRYGGRDGAVADFWHIYDNACDTSCNDCGEARVATHNFPTEACAELCKTCGATRQTTVPHTYSEVKSPVDGNPIAGSIDCDTMCDVCLEEREVPHVLRYPCSPICTKCFAVNKTPHTYDNDCDKECNVCKTTRKTSHKYLNVCDASCENCGEIRTAETDKSFDPDHDYDNACDAECNICKATRTVEAHKYDNECDAKCNVCDAERTVADHTYDNACDATCNKCNAERSVAGHAYDNDCDTDCNTCGATREIAHDFGIWITSKEATKDEAGEEKRFCNKCQFVEVRETPMLEGGLGVGAIIGIVAGSVAVLGGGGFCLWWFVIRKKFN